MRASSKSALLGAAGTLAAGLATPESRVVHVTSGSAYNPTSIPIPSGVHAGNGLLVMLYGASDNSVSAAAFTSSSTLAGFTNLGAANKGTYWAMTSFFKAAASSGDASGGTWALGSIAATTDVAWVIYEITGATTATMTLNNAFNNTVSLPVGSSQPVNALAIGGALGQYGTTPSISSSGWNSGASGNVKDSGATKGLGYGSAVSHVLSGGSTAAGSFATAYGNCVSATVFLP